MVSQIFAQVASPPPKTPSISTTAPATAHVPLAPTPPGSTVPDVTQPQLSA